MKAWFLRGGIALCLSAMGWIAFGQVEPPPAPEVQRDTKLPNGKSQREEILKAEREQNIRDAAQLVDLSKELRLEIEKNESYVLSIATLKKTDEIEKLAKRIRGRLRHN